MQRKLRIILLAKYMRFSVGYCCKIGIGFADYYKAVEQDDKDRYYMVIVTHMIFATILHAATSGSAILMMMFM